jgi:hypothetical protein
MGEMRNVLNTLNGKLEGKRPLGRPKHRWEDDIRTGLRERGWEVVEWMHVAQDREQWRNVKRVINLRVQ